MTELVERNASKAIYIRAKDHENPQVIRVAQAIADAVQLERAEVELSWSDFELEARKALVTLKIKALQGIRHDEMEAEEWRPIPGYESTHQASSLGRIKSFFSGKILKPRLSTEGYLQVSVYLGTGGRRGHNINRLVCLAFHGEPAEEDMHAAHLDGDRCNNRAANLAWATPSENSKHKEKHGSQDFFPVGCEGAAA